MRVYIQIGKNFFRHIDTILSKKYFEKFKVNFLRNCNLLIDRMIEYTPFWFKLEKVEIVKSNS